MKAPVVVVALLAFAASSGGAFAATATSADRSFVAKVSQGGAFEVEAGRLADQKGSAQDIRDFGAMEVHDHMLVGDKLKAISSQEGVSFSPNLDQEFSTKLAHLRSLSGPAFDAAYMQEMATLHAGDGAAFAKEAQQGGSVAYRDFGAETAKIVQRHIGAIHGATPPMK